MEPLMPSEIARLVYGYLKNEKNEDTAECFLKSSPCLTECYQMFKTKRNFNIKVNGFNLHDIFDLFGTMSSMIEERISETCESKTLIEKLQYLLDLNHTTTKEDKSTEIKLNMVDKCVGNRVHTKDQGTHISINIEANKSTCTSEELLKVPLFPEIISNNVYKTEEVDSFNNETTLNNERNLSTFSLSSPSSEIHLIDNNVRATFFKIEDKQSPIFQVNKQMCSTPEKKKDEPKISIESIPQFSPKYIHNLISVDQTKYQKVPEATSLDSMPGFSKEDRIKDGSIVIDTGELVDTFLNDQKGNLDPPTLEKALNSTQTDPQIKNILDEFLVFNVDNAEIGKKAYTNDHLGSIKSRLRSAKKKDDVLHKFKKNSFNNQNHIVYGNEECIQVDNNIVLIHEGNIKTTAFESYDLLSNQLVLLSTDSYNFDSTKIEPEENCLSKANYVKIAPKITPLLKIQQVPEKQVFPKRRKHGIMSKFGKRNIISRQLPIQTPKSIIIEVPSQRSFETQEKINIEKNDIIKLPEVSSKVNDTICYNTPVDRLQPPKNKSMSTPRRRRTHVRCLDFTTPQPKNMTQNQAHSRLLYNTHKKFEKCLEEPSSSPIPVLQADWGSVNGFESIIKKENIKHWDTDIREMVGAGILTSDADGRKRTKKKTPIKNIKRVIDQNNSIVLTEEQKKSSNNLIIANEFDTDISSISESTYDDLNKPLKEQIKFPISLENSGKIIELFNEQTPIVSDTSINVNNKKLLKNQSELMTPFKKIDKITELNNGQLSIKSDSLKSQCGITQIHSEQSHANINEQENNQNQLIKSPSLEIEPKKTKQEKDPNFLKMFNNYNYLLTKKKLIKSTKYLKEQGLLDKTHTNNSNELSSPMKPISIEPVNTNLVETPYKRDDGVVDVPKTPISKIKCLTQVNSLTETPSIEVFKKTSYLNKQPILQFPSTSRNLGSVDTLIVLPEQDSIKTSKNTNCEIGLREFLNPSIQIKTTNNKLSNKTKIDKFECTPLKSKVKCLSKSKVKSLLKRKNIEAKKKQFYESVKVELFGSEVSSSSSSCELINTNEQTETIIINKKPQDKEKISGFKHIPKRKIVNSMPVVNVTSVENHLLNELNNQPTKIPSIKPIIVQHENNNDNTSEKIKKENSKNIKKFMVHFDDPIEKIFSLSKSPSKSTNKNTSKIPKKNTINDNSEQLIGLSRYLNKTSRTYGCRLKGKKVKTIEPRIKTTKTDNINSKMHNVNRSSENISTSYSSNKKKSHDMKNQRIKLSESCITDLNEVSYEIENNAVHNKNIVPLDFEQTKCLDDNIFNPNCITNKNNNIVNNISCVTIRHDDKLDTQINKISDPIDYMEYLKKSKVYEVITEDGKHEMVYLHLSEKFIFLDILSELDSTQLSDPITSTLITVNKKLGDISEIESGELTNDEEILIPITSTPKDGVKIKNDKNNRARRSPSIWEDSFHNYPIRHRNNRYRETSYLQNNIHRKYDKYRTKKIQHHNDRLQFNNQNHFQRSNHQNVKREFWKDIVRGTDKFKHKDEKRCYHDYSKGKNWVEENPQRMSQSDVQKFRRSENIVNKALKRPINQEINNKTPAKVSKVEHQRLLTNVDVDDFLSVVHGKNKNL
ncbi:metacaspase-2-like isoform X2 [Aphis gossypii]|uniref:metacaspase-2-like isoform X2 n=1 Tax=Aphis gossypii TaxID=80765 RepID=UPI002159539C|nr:metacaspase-2-like isoform X2 [Aphis gossypii]